MDFANWTIPETFTSDAAKVFFAALLTGAFVRLVRAALRWFKRAGTEKED